MPEPDIDYESLVQEALRGVVRNVLSQVETDGLAGNHHFYVAFDTRAEGVSLSKRLKEQYPEEMTIVLQHRFWDLHVGPERFEVKLTFGNIPERLSVPYSAIKVFFDPSVPYGLQFEPSKMMADAAKQPSQITSGVELTDEDGKSPTLSALPGAQGAAASSVDVMGDAGNDETSEDDEEKRGPANVVELDAFRKK